MLTWVQYKVENINPHPCLFHGTQNTEHHVIQQPETNIENLEIGEGREQMA